MKDIEKILENASLQDVQIPPKIEYRIQYTLKNKNLKKRHYIRKFMAALASTVIVFIGSISVYAAFGGTVSGKPVIEWLGIKFSDEYEDYKVNVEGQGVSYNETKIDLVSTVCDDIYTILEFDVKLSKEDKEYLRLGETVITEQELEEAKIREEEYKKNDVMSFPAGKEPYSMLVRYKDLINTMEIKFNENYNELGKTRCNIIIDGEKRYVISSQTVTQVSEYEYKVYQLYFLTEKDIGDKTDFTISLTANWIGNRGDADSFFRLHPDAGIVIGNTENNARKRELNGEFNVHVSKSKALENTKVIKDIPGESTYKHMTKRVEEVRVTPLQIVAKVTTKVDNLSLQSLSSTMNKDYIGINGFNVYDGEGNKLSAGSHEIKRTITYANGKVEEWAPGDIGTFRSFYNAKMELVEYITIEKRENVDVINIVPTVRELNFDDGKEKVVELKGIEVNLKGD